MSSEPDQLRTDVVSPGAKLKKEREAMGMSEREAADRLNWMPDYVGVIEQDDYHRLRNPAFARGYVKAYARLVGLSEDQLVAEFDVYQQNNVTEGVTVKRSTKPLRLQRTGLGAVVGIGALVVLVIFMWWRGA